MPKMYKMEKVCAGYGPNFGPVVPCGVLMDPVVWEAEPGEPEPTQQTHGMCEDCFAKQMVEINAMKVMMEGSKL